MAAYAALVSLFNTLDHIHNHPGFSTSLNKYQIQSLNPHIDFLLDFVESYNIDGGISLEGARELKKEIVRAAHAAEDIIESHIVNLILPESTGISDVSSHRRCFFSLQKILHEMYSIKEKVLKIKEESGFNDQKPTKFTLATSSTPLTNGQNRMVGFEDELMQLMDVLIKQQSSRQIISIVGMGGSGKTTLAKNVYEDSLTLHHFDLRAWATISQEYDVRDILLDLLSEAEGTLDELGEKLHKKLYGRRYLIVLDDMWSMEVWDRIKFFFPDNCNGSGIVLTTRLINVATLLGSICIRVKFLDEDRSWNLFCQNIFGQDDCPVELKRIGKKIVGQCKGLPLSIIVIGGLLKKSHRTKECWKSVAKNINAIFNSIENGQCLDVLYLSYSHLPAHLKPCFLYTGTFKEDTEIRVSKIIKLWVAEGFLKPNGAQLLEEMAEDYLKDLIDRNLILVCEHRSNGKIRSFRVHDLLRELCLRVADKEGIFCVVREYSIPQGIDRERCLIYHHNTPSFGKNEVHKAFQSAPLARSLICNIDEAPPGKCRLLRVFNGAYDRDHNMMVRVAAEFQNANLRYITCPFPMFPPSVSLMWNLQTLDIERFSPFKGQRSVPLEIWKMTQLRHLKCYTVVLPDPPPIVDKDDDSVVLRNLQTLATVMDFRLNEEAFKRIPNIKKLHIVYGRSNNLRGEDYISYVGSCYDDLQNLGRLQRLESIQIRFDREIPIRKLKNAFPSSINQLILGGRIPHLEELSMIIGGKNVFLGQ